MRALGILAWLLFSCAVQAQVYRMGDPALGATVTTCSGTFYDSGGPSGAYGPNENYQITFCPATPGAYVQLSFAAFDVEGEPFDYLTIYNGPNTSGAVIGAFGNTLPGGCDVIASSHPSGCITLVFRSDGSVQSGGWQAAISCATTSGGTPIAVPDNAICSGAGPFCADSGSLEFPNISDGCAAAAPIDVATYTCLLTAPNPAWYFLEVGVPGTINLEIEQTTGPGGTGTGLDVDYAIWGPFANSAAACANFTLGACAGDHNCFGNVVDCSYSVDAVETAVIPNALTGQIYMVLITNYDGAPGFIRMTQTNAGSAGAGSTDCSIVCPSFAGTSPAACGGTNGSITISGLDPNTSYTVTYLDDGIPASANVTGNASGIAVISGLNAGNYTNLATNFAGCTTAYGNVVLTSPAALSITSITTNSPVCSGANALFSIAGTPNATVTYTINDGGIQTVTLDATGMAVVTVTGMSANTTLSTVSIGLPGCVVPVVISKLVMLSQGVSVSLSSGNNNTSGCIGVPITNIVYTLGPGVTSVSVTGFPAGISGQMIGNEFVISGAASVSGIFPFSGMASGPCGSAPFSGSVAIGQGVSISLLSGNNNTSGCIGVPITDIVYTLGPGVTSVSASGFPAGISGQVIGNEFVISGAASASGTFPFSGMASGSCGSAPFSGSVAIGQGVSISLLSGNSNTSGCIGVPITNIVYTLGPGVTSVSATGFPAGISGQMIGNEFVISGAASVSGTFPFSGMASGSCGSAPFSGSVAIGQGVSISLFSGNNNTSGCIGIPITNIVYTLGPGVTSVSATGLPAGISGQMIGNEFVISGAASVSGTFPFSGMASGSCGSAPFNGIIAIENALSLTLQSPPATESQHVCIGVAIDPIVYATANATIVHLSDVPAGLSYGMSGGLLTISGVPSASGEFTMNLTISNHCATLVLPVSISILPDATLAPHNAALTHQTLCVDSPIDPILYTIGPATTGVFVSGLPAGVSHTVTGNTLMLAGTPVDAGIFSFSVSGSGCAAPMQTGTLVVTQKPTVHIGYASPFCATAGPQPVNISGTGAFSGGTFSVGPGLSLNPVTGSVDPSLSVPGTYTIEYTTPSAGGCSGVVATSSITVTPMPTATIGYGGPFCADISSPQAVTLTGTAQYTGGVFSSDPGLHIDAVTGAITPSLSAPGQYHITYAVPAMAGCPPLPVQTQVTIRAIPSVTTTPALPMVCTGGTVHIALSDALPGTTFWWTVLQNNVTGALAGAGNVIAQTLTNTGNAIGTVVYNVVPVSAEGCAGPARLVTVRVHPLPEPHLQGGVMCINANTGAVVRSMVLDAGLNNADHDFLWTLDGQVIPGAHTNIHEATAPGTYALVATNSHTGCASDIAGAVVTATYVADVAILSGNDAFSDESVITVTVAGSGQYEYQLDHGAYQTENVFTGLTLGEHTLRVRDQDGCTDIVQTFTVLGYPKFFTPNGDGYNDQWNIFALAGQSGSRIFIFDRYGKLLKQISPAGQGWDGTFNGQAMPATDYWFVVEYLDKQIKKEFRAHFSLKR